MFKYFIRSLVLFYSVAALSENFVGILNSDTGATDLPATIQPIFKFENSKWSAISKIECQKMPAIEWHILFDGKAKEKVTATAMQTEYQKSHCYFGVSSLPKLPKTEVVVGSDMKMATDPARWKPFSLTKSLRPKLGIPKNAKIIKAFQNKNKDLFLTMHIPPMSKDDDIGSFLSGFWNSKNTNVWKTESSFITLVDAGSYAMDGQSQIVISEANPGGLRYLLFSNTLEKLSESTQ